VLKRKVAMKIFRWVLMAVGLALAMVACSWTYTAVQLNIARAKGVYSSPEQGMIARAEQHYTVDRQVKILYAGTNSFDGTNPHIWYVIAEIRAASRVEASVTGFDGCDAPGSFFLQTKEGWVHIPEGAFPEFLGFWMKVFGWAGEGQSTPSTDWAPDQPSRFCQ
jgi:hypothetical protein